MVLKLIEEQQPLDEVIFYDTGMEFQAIYDIRDKIKVLLKEKNIKFTELKPEYDFEYKMFEKPVEERSGGVHYGYSWCGGTCRWGTTDKELVCFRYLKNNYGTYGIDYVEYIGIAADEPDRIKHKVYPLEKWGMKEKDCLEYCYSKGFYWEEKSPVTKSGYIRLYDILDRVSCWCCANKNQWELYNIWHYFRNTYWQWLKDMQSRADVPMKKFKNKKFGEYGNVFDLEKVFESGYVPKHRKKSSNN